MRILYVFLFITICSAQVFVNPIPQRRGTTSSPAVEEVTLRDTARYFSTNITSMPKPFTVSSNTNTVLYVANVRYTAAAGRRDTAMTWDDVNLTFIDSVQSGNCRIDLWRLINPTAKADTVKSFYNSATAGYGSMWISVYSGLNQTTPNTEPDSALTSNATSLAVTVNNNGAVASGDSVVGIIAFINATTVTDSAGQVNQANQLLNGSLGWRVSTRPSTGTSARMAFNSSASTRLILMAYALKKN